MNDIGEILRLHKMEGICLTSEKSSEEVEPQDHPVVERPSCLPGCVPGEYHINGCPWFEAWLNGELEETNDA